jgi:hypothetical protein
MSPQGPGLPAALERPMSNVTLSELPRTGELCARVANIPANLIAAADGHVPHETIAATLLGIGGMAA